MYLYLLMINKYKYILLYFRGEILLALWIFVMVKVKNLTYNRKTIYFLKELKIIV